MLLACSVSVACVSLTGVHWQATHITSPLGKDFCEFETITMAPIQQALIDTTMLTPQEVAWLNAYHTDVRAKLEPLLANDADALAYLARETAPLALH